MLNKYSLGLLVATGVYATTSQAAYLTESYADNSVITSAQFIDDIYFTSGYDADINTESGINISTSSLHASVLASGDNTVDFYGFNGIAGQAYFDIDYAMDFGGSFDSWMQLYDASFNLLATNDDSSIESGSVHSFDSFISYNLTSNDVYYVAVGSYPSLGDIPFGANYTLQISQQVSPVPVPAAVWLFGSGLLALAGFMRRKQNV